MSLLSIVTFSESDAAQVQVTVQCDALASQPADTGVGHVGAGGSVLSIGIIIVLQILTIIIICAMAIASNGRHQQVTDSDSSVQSVLRPGLYTRLGVLWRRLRQTACPSQALIPQIVGTTQVPILCNPYCAFCWSAAAHYACWSCYKPICMNCLDGVYCRVCVPPWRGLDKVKCVGAKTARELRQELIQLRRYVRNTVDVNLQKMNGNLQADKAGSPVVYPAEGMPSRQGTVCDTRAQEAMDTRGSWPRISPDLMCYATSRFWQSCVQHYRALSPSAAGGLIAVHLPRVGMRSLPPTEVADSPFPVTNDFRGEAPRSR